MGSKDGKKTRKKEETKKVKNKKVKNTDTNKKEKKKKGKHPKLKLFIKIMMSLILIGIIVGVGVAVAVVAGVLREDEKITAADLSITTMNSVLIDLNGNEVATLNGDENREVVLLSEMGEYLPKAFVAIEDKRFYEHSGVDIKRTFGATVKYVLGNSTYGGSTITQQLIKNATGEKDKSWKRKIKEITRAYQIEKEMSKDQILEAYLNTIPLGGGAKNVYGVKVASNYYFDKEPADLTLPEAAYIAGINHSPNLYNPFKEKPNMERIKNRTKTVLNEMLDQGKIDETQYNEAVTKVDEGLDFKEGKITNNNSLTQNEEAAVKQVIREYAESKDLSYEVAEQKIKSGGFKIYITEDANIQKILDDAYTSNTDWMKTKTVTRKDENGDSYKKTLQVQSAMVVIDHKTGYVVGCVGNLGEKSPWGTNRALTAGHQPGSSIKPLAVISPSLQENLITAGTVIDDTPVSFGSYRPKNDTGANSFYGLMNIRYILRVSRNVPETKMIQKLTPAKSIEYLKSYGITSLSDKDLGISLALGGVTNGISPLEMAGAYATIANDGVYIEPTFYIKVEDSNGKVIMEKEQETHRVISEQNAWIMQSLLTEPLGAGLTGSSGATGTRAKVSGMQTCGKTGTTDDKADTWFCGFTPYYAASMYFAFDEKDIKIDKNYLPGSSTVAGRWGTIMNKIHSGLKAASFDKPAGIVSAKVCSKSGLRATDLCSEAGCAYSEYYAKGTVPTETCTTHVKLKVCKETGKLANEFCKDVEEKIFITRPNSDTDTAWQKAADAELMAPTETCTTHVKPLDKTKPEIKLKGEKVVTVTLDGKYTEPGYTATDDVDGDITNNVKVTGEVNTKKVGEYTLTYTVSDAAGNEAKVTRTVKVVKKDDNKNNVNTNTIGNNTVTNTTNNTVGNNTSTNTTTNTINANKVN